MTKTIKSVEEEIQRILPRSTPIQIDGSLLYMLSFQGDVFYRYVEGTKHITGDYRHEYVNEPWYYWPSYIARFLFSTKQIVLKLDSPVCWDNEDDPISDEDLRGILSRIESALRKRYKRFKIEINNYNAV
jgi:hypothetical protein